MTARKPGRSLLTPDCLLAPPLEPDHYIPRDSESMRALYRQRAAPEPHPNPSAAVDAEAAVITARVQPVALRRNNRVDLRHVGLSQRLVRRRVPNGEGNPAAHARTCDPNAFHRLSALVRAD